MNTFNRMLWWLRVTRLELFLLIYLLIYGGIAVAMFIGSLFAEGEYPDGVQAVYAFLAGIVAFGYGIFRSIYFNPFEHTNHGRWLRDSAWRHPQRLPLGPLHLILQDAFLLGFITLTLPVSLELRVTAPLSGFALGYCLVIWSTALNLREYLLGYAIPVLLGLVALAIWWYAAIGFIVIAVIGLAFAQISTRQVLTRFDEFDFDAARPFFGGKAQSSKQQPDAGWPTATLLSPTTERRLSAAHAIGIGLIVAWLVMAIAGPCEYWLARHDLYADDPNGAFNNSKGIKNFRELYLLFANVVVLTIVLFPSIHRFHHFCLAYTPPISLWGRLRTGRLIIPAYDQVFVAPLAGLIIATGLPFLLAGIGLPVSVSIAIAAGLAVAAVLGLPPSLDEWRHTGGHRIRHRTFLAATKTRQTTTT